MSWRSEPGGGGGGGGAGPGAGAGAGAVVVVVVVVVVELSPVHQSYTCLSVTSVEDPLL